MHLWEKRHRFDPARGSPGTFASTVLDRWIAQYLRDRGRIKRGGTYRTTPFSQIEKGAYTKSSSLEGQLTAGDGDRRRCQHTSNHIECFDRMEALGVAFSLLSDHQTRVLEEVVAHSVSCAARDLGVSRRQIENEMKDIRTIFIKCGLSL